MQTYTPENSLLRDIEGWVIQLLMVNFMKFSWRENFIEIFTLKFFKFFYIVACGVLLHRIKKIKIK